MPTYRSRDGDTMKRSSMGRYLAWAVCGFAWVSIAGCGGGGGGGASDGVTVRGMAMVSVDGAIVEPDPPATVTIAGVSVRTVKPPLEAAGYTYNFQITLPAGSTVNTGTVSATGAASAQFPLPPLPASGVVNIGQVYCGDGAGIAQVTGRIVSAVGGGAVANARVTIGAMTVQTGADGRFVMDRAVALLDTVTLSAAGFLTRTVTLPFPLATGANDLGDLSMAPDNITPDPPGMPGNLKGTITLNGASAAGVTVTLTVLQSGATVETKQTSTGVYQFWLQPGSYRLRAAATGYATWEQAVTIPSDGSVVTRAIDLGASAP